MSKDPWMALWNESMKIYDWTEYYKQAERWSTQGIDLWTDMQTYTQALAPAHLWMDAAMTFSDQWKAAIQNWGVAPAPPKPDIDEKEILKLKQQVETAQADLKAQKQELTTLKRAVTQKEKQLNQKADTITKQSSLLAEKDQQIKVMQGQLDRQAAQLRTLEAQAKKSTMAVSAAPPTVPAVKGP